MITQLEIEPITNAVPTFLRTFGLDGEARYHVSGRSIEVVFWPIQQQQMVSIPSNSYLAQSPSDFAELVGGSLVAAIRQSGFATKASVAVNSKSVDLAMAADALGEFGRENAEPAIKWLGLLSRLSDDQLEQLGSHLQDVVNHGARL